MEFVQSNLSLIALFPLMGSVIAYVVGKQNKDASGWIASGASILSFLWVLKCFFALGEKQVLEHVVFQWFAVEGLSLDFTLRFDHLTAVMALVVTGIGSLIHIYSVAYMHEDESRPRFFAYLNLFMFSMLLLILGGNLLVLFVGWEGVGLCSYLLIGFWHKNSSYAGAGRKAFVVNRIGDAGVLLAMFLLVMHFQTLDFVELQAKFLGLISPDLCLAIALLLFVGATGKSAQIPLFVWLPDAMAGPTPVSALIHAATMVTAGVYMMARCHFIFSLAPTAQFIIVLIALLTAFVAATTALAQNDIKKVLAYSTVSQLGFMFMAAGAGAYWVAIFHVITHAFFKACLFLGAGSVIHGCHHEQDMRHMGGLSKLMPITFATYAISTLAIAGIYPFAGYQSKHGILGALTDSTNTLIAPYAETFVLIASLTAFLTAFYMTRSVAMTFLGEYRGHAHPHESPWVMVGPLIVLAVLATVGGVYLLDIASLQHYLGHSIPVGQAHAHESILSSVMHSWVGLLGVGLALVMYTKLSALPKAAFNAIPALSKLFENKYYVDELYALCIVRPLEGAARLLWKIVDQGIIDGSVNGVAAVVDISGEVLRSTQTGQMRHYALFIFGSSVLIIVFFLAM